MIIKKDIIYYEISEEWNKSSDEYARMAMEDYKMRNASDKRGFKPKNRSKKIGRLGELAIRRLLMDNDISFEVEAEEDIDGKDNFDIKVSNEKIQIKSKDCQNQNYNFDWSFMVVADQYHRYIREKVDRYIFCIVQPSEVHIIGQISHSRFNEIKKFGRAGTILRDGYKIKSPDSYYIYIDGLNPISEFIDRYSSKDRFKLKKTNKKLNLSDFM